METYNDIFNKKVEKVVNKYTDEKQKQALHIYYNYLWEYIAAYDKWNTMELLEDLESAFARLKELGIDTTDQDLEKFWEVL